MSQLQFFHPVKKLSNPDEDYSQVTLKRYLNALKKAWRGSPEETIVYLNTTVPSDKPALEKRALESTACALFFRQEGLQEFCDSARDVTAFIGARLRDKRKITGNDFTQAELQSSLPWDVIVSKTKTQMRKWKTHEFPEHLALVALMVLGNNGGPRRNEYLLLNVKESGNTYKNGKIVLDSYKTSKAYGAYEFSVSGSLKNLLDSLGKGPVFEGLKISDAFFKIIGTPIGSSLLRKIRITHFFVYSEDEQEAAKLARLMGNSVGIQVDHYVHNIEQYKTELLGKKKIVKNVSWTSVLVDELEKLCKKYGPDNLKEIREHATAALIVLDGPRKNGIPSKIQNEYVKRIKYKKPVGGFEGATLWKYQSDRLN